MKRIFLTTNRTNETNLYFFSMPWDGNEGKRMAGVLHSEKSAGFHSSGLPIKNDSPHSENWLRRAKGSLLKIISPMNPLDLLNHREAVFLYKNKFLRND